MLCSGMDSQVIYDMLDADKKHRIDDFNFIQSSSKILVRMQYAGRSTAFFRLADIQGTGDRSAVRGIPTRLEDMKCSCPPGDR